MDPYLVLGVHSKSSDSEVEAAYGRLREALDLTKFSPGSLGYRQCEECLSSIDKAFHLLTDPSRKATLELPKPSEGGCNAEIKPRLGHLGVAAGMVSLDDVQKAVRRQTTEEIPIGQIFQEEKLMSQREVEGLLVGQEMIRIPVNSAYYLAGRRLSEIGAVSEDMVSVAYIEHKTTGRDLYEILVDRGWLDKDLAQMLHMGLGK